MTGYLQRLLDRTAAAVTPITPIAPSNLRSPTSFTPPVAPEVVDADPSFGVDQPEPPLTPARQDAPGATNSDRPSARPPPSFDRSFITERVIEHHIPEQQATEIQRPTPIQHSDPQPPRAIAPTGVAPPPVGFIAESDLVLPEDDDVNTVSAPQHPNQEHPNPAPPTRTGEPDTVEPSIPPTLPPLARPTREELIEPQPAQTESLGGRPQEPQLETAKDMPFAAPEHALDRVIEPASAHAQAAPEPVAPPPIILPEMPAPLETARAKEDAPPPSAIRPADAPTPPTPVPEAAPSAPRPTRPMTAAEASVIGPLPDRRRALTYFGMRRR